MPCQEPAGEESLRLGRRRLQRQVKGFGTMIAMVNGQTKFDPSSTTGESSRGPDERLTGAALFQLLVDQEFRCALTGDELTPENATLDHRIPRKHGGSDSVSNLQWVIKQANAAKGTMMMQEFVDLCRRVVALHDGDSKDAVPIAPRAVKVESFDSETDQHPLTEGPNLW